MTIQSQLISPSISYGRLSHYQHLCSSLLPHDLLNGYVCSSIMASSFVYWKCNYEGFHISGSTINFRTLGFGVYLQTHVRLWALECTYKTTRNVVRYNKKSMHKDHTCHECHTSNKHIIHTVHTHSFNITPKCCLCHKAFTRVQVHRTQP